MYCRHCGAEITDEMKFCPVCGAEVGSIVSKSTSLVSMAKEGDQEAFSQLFNENYAKVLYAIRSVISDEDTAMDILQDTFVKAFEKIGQIENDAKFTPWVKTIAVNTAKDYLKKKKPVLFADMKHEDEEDADLFEESLVDDRTESMPDVVLDQSETARLLREIMEGIPEDQRIVINLYYYDEMSVREIASLLDVSESAVKNRLAYGRKKIKTQVEILERKGTKLYGLAPVPFLLFLWKNMDAQASQIVPDASCFSSIKDAMMKEPITASSSDPGVSSESYAASSKSAESHTASALTGATGASSGITGGAGAAAGISTKTAAIIAAVVVAAGGGAVAISQFSGSTTSVEAQWQEKYDLGVQYYEDGQYEDAVDAFTEAITIIEEEPDAYAGRADSYIELDEDEAALGDYLSAISYGIEDADVYVNAAEIYVNMEDYENAASLLENAPESDEASELLAAVQNEIAAAQYLTLALEYEAAGELNAAIHTLWEGRQYWEDGSEIYEAYQRLFVPITSIETYDASGAARLGYEYEYDGKGRITLIREISGISGHLDHFMHISFEYSEEENDVLRTLWYQYTSGESTEPEVSSYSDSKTLALENLKVTATTDSAYSVTIKPYVQTLDETRIWNEETYTEETEAYEWDYADLTYNEDGLIVRMDFYREDGTYTGWAAISYDGYEETIAFDTSGQITEAILYNANNIIITAEKLVYTEDTVDLVLYVENNSDGYISVLNQAGGDGVPYVIRIGGALFQSYLGTLYETESIAPGETEVTISISIDDLIYSGVFGIPDIHTFLTIYEAEFDEAVYEYFGEETYSRSGVIIEEEVDIDLTTSLYENYNFDVNGTEAYILDEIGERSFGYTILASDYDITSVTDDSWTYYSAAAIALVEEEDGDIVFLVETDENTQYSWWALGLYINGIPVYEYDGYYTSNFYGTVEGERKVLIYGITAECRKAYGLETITSASLTEYWTGEIIEVFSLATGE